MTPRCAHWWISIAILFYSKYLALGFKLDPRIPNDLYEESSPAIVTLSHVRRDEFSSDNVYHVTVKAFDEELKLKLLRTTSPISPDVRIFESGDAEDVREIHYNKRELGPDLKLYTDETRSASLVVEDYGESLHLEGTLNENLRIDTKKSDGSRVKRGESATHMVYRRTQTHSGKTRSTDIRVAPGVSRIANPEFIISEKRQNLGYKLEIFLVLDYETTQYFYSNMSEIIRYYSIFYNEVQHFFDNLGSDPSIKLFVTSIHLTTSKLKEEFLRRLFFFSQRIDPDKTLDLFGAWLFKFEAVFGNYDISMLITGLDMGTLNFWNWPQWDGITNGIAYIGTACYIDHTQRISFKSGASEDVPGTFVGAMTHAHEIGHLLGCTHDNSSAIMDNQPNAMDCPWSDGFLMSYAYGNTNKFHFSPCSIKQMKWYLDSGFADCLYDSPNTTAFPFNPQLPGEIISLNEQCQNTFADKRYYHSNPPGNDICLKLHCVSPADPVGNAMGPAFEGSPCGNNTICLKGVCTSAAG